MKYQRISKLTFLCVEETGGGGDVIFLKLWSLFCFGSICPIPTIMIIWTWHHLPDFSMMSRIYLKIAEAILEKKTSSLTANPSNGQRKLLSLLWDPRTQCPQVLNEYQNSTPVFHTSFQPSFCWDIALCLFPVYGHWVRMYEFQGRDTKAIRVLKWIIQNPLKLSKQQNICNLSLGNWGQIAFPNPC